MASDGIQIAAGGELVKVATDDADAQGHVQVVKPAVATDGSAHRLPGDAANGMDVDVTRLPPVGHDVTAISDGRAVVATAGTRVPLAASTAAKHAIITALETNVGVIRVGGATVAAGPAGSERGIPLRARDSVSLPCDNLADIKIDATVSGEGVEYAWLA